MTTMINSYSIGFSLDNSSYLDASKLTRAEANAMNRAINSSRTPMERYERELNTLEKALESGAIDQRVYNRLLGDAREKYRAAAESADRLSRQQSSLSSGLGPLKGLVAGYLSFSGAKRAVDAVHESMQRLDATAKQARAIGSTVADLQKFQFVAGQMSGIDPSQSIQLLTKMTQRVGEASLGIGEAAANFERLNLDAQKLRDLSPTEQFKALANAIGQIESPTERAAMATRFFEEQGVKLLNVLTASPGAYDETADKLERIGGVIDDIDAAKIEALNDRLDDLAHAYEGFNARAAIGLEQSIGDFTSLFTNLAAQFHAAEDAGTNLVGIVGALGTTGVSTSSIISDAGLAIAGSVEAAERIQSRFGAAFLSEEMQQKVAAYREQQGQIKEAQEGQAAALEKAAAAEQQLQNAAQARAEAEDAAMGRLQQMEEQQAITFAQYQYGEEGARKLQLAMQGADDAGRAWMADMISAGVELDTIMLQASERVREQIDVLEQQRELNDSLERQAKLEQDIADARKHYHETLADNQERNAEELLRRMEKMASDISKGPQSLEVGSGADVQFAAQQENKRLAAEAIKNQANLDGGFKPTREQLERDDKAAEELKGLREMERQAQAERQKQTELMRQMADNAVERIR